jgi:hypothetical protein
MNIPNSQKIALKIKEIINGQDIEDVKVALMGIWNLIHDPAALEKE